MQEDGGFQNFSLGKASGRNWIMYGTILPAFDDGRDWQLDDPGDTP